MGVDSLRYAIRTLTRARGFAGVTVATIALAVAGGCTVFALVDTVVLRPLPFPEPNRLVGIWHTMPGIDVPLAKQALGTYAVYRAGGQSFESMGLYITLAATLSYPSPNTPVERARVAYATASTLETLRIKPLLGRPLIESDENLGAEPVVLIGERMWLSRFHADPRVTKLSIIVDGVPRRIVGVMPKTFAFPETETPAWLPLNPAPNGYLGGFGYGSVARLRPFVTIEDARAELARLLRRVPARFPETKPGVSSATVLEQTRLAPVVHALRNDVVGDFDRLLWLIGAGVAILVVVAFANVSLLLLVRIEARQRELAVRSALGASRLGVFRLLMLEGAILAACGGTLGFALAALGIRALLRAPPIGIPRLGELHVSATLVLSALALSVCFAAVSATIATARVRSKDVIRLLRDGGRTGTSGRAAQRTRAAFIGVEVALSLVLLAGSGVLGRSKLNLSNVRPGFDPSNLFTFWTFLPATTYKTPEQVAHFYANAIEQIRQLPGVTAVAATAKLPLETEGFAYRVLIFADDGMNAGNNVPPVFQATSVTGGYFATMRIPLIAGRTFDDAHVRQGGLEAIASRGFIEHFWHDSTGRSGVGKRLRPVANGPWFTVVGVVGDIRDSTLTQPPVSEVYFPEEPNGDTTGAALTTGRDMAFVIRTRGPVPALASLLRRDLAGLDPSLPFYRPTTVDQLVVDARAQLSVALMTFAIGAVATLLLGVIGLYGAIAYAVSLRSREIAIRIALGLSPDNAVKLLVSQGQVVVAAGALAGSMVFLGLAKLLRSVAFDVPVWDTVSLVGALVLVVVAALLASWLPARRAALVDPARTLSSE